MMKKILSLILIACMLLVGLTGCQSSGKNKGLDAKTREKYYLERIDAYREYFKDYEDKYEVEAGIALDKQQLPVMWIMIYESEYTAEVKLVSYDNEKEKIEVLGEEWIDVEYYDGFEISILPDDNYLVLEVGSDLIVYDEEEKKLLYNEEAEYPYEYFGMSQEEFLKDGDDIADFYSSAFVIARDDDRETLIYIGETTQNSSFAKLDMLDALDYTEGALSVSGECVMISEEYANNEAAIEEFKKFAKASKLPKEAQEYQDEVLEEAEEILDMGVEEISAEYDVSKNEATKIMEAAELFVEIGFGYYDYERVELTYANGEKQTLKKNTIYKNDWEIEEYYVYFMNGLGFETLLDKLYRNPAYTIGDLELVYYSMDFGYTIEKFDKSMIPEVEEETKNNADKNTVNSDLVVIGEIRNYIVMALADEALIDSTASKDGAKVVSGKFNISDLFSDSDVSVNLAREIESYYGDTVVGLSSIESDCTIRLVEFEPLKGTVVLSIDAEGTEYDYYIDTAGTHKGTWTE